MDQQQDITQFQSQFNGPYPFTSAGVLVGLPDTAFEEEMVTMIVFFDGTIDLDIFNHENMHQWWGDNVTEANYDMTFFKEGLATLGEYLFHARTAETAAGGPSSPRGAAAFEASLIQPLRLELRRDGLVLAQRPVRPDAVPLFCGNYDLHSAGDGYLALRQILGHGQVHDRAAHDPARVRRCLDHRSATGGRVRAATAQPERRLQGAAGPVLHAVVGHGVPDRDGRDRAAITGPGTGRRRLLRRRRLHP